VAFPGADDAYSAAYFEAQLRQARALAQKLAKLWASLTPLLGNAYKARSLF